MHVGYVTEATLVKTDHLITAYTEEGFVFLAKSEARPYWNGDVIMVEILSMDTNKLPVGRIKRLVRRSTQVEKIFGIVGPNRVFHTSSDVINGLNLDSFREGDELFYCSDGSREWLGNIFERYHDEMTAKLRCGVIPYPPIPLLSPVIDRDRIDQLDLCTFTIDPEGCVDHDDAMSVDVENHTVYIHIADVASIMAKDCEMDQQCKRQTSTLYLNGSKPFHMIPENWMREASLFEGKNRRVVTLEIDCSPDHPPRLKRRPYRSWIRNKHEWTYGQVLPLLDQQPFAFLVDVMRRFPLSDISLKMPCRQLVLNEQGYLTECKIVSNDDLAHRLIQYFMLLSNKFVAETLSEDGVLYPRRCHLPAQNLPSTRQIRQLVNEQLLPYLTRAFYTCRSLQHYGVGFSEYTHFTSPIRRYVDVIVQRLLMRDCEYSSEELDDICRNSTIQQNTYELVGQWFEKVKLYDYIRRRQGATYPSIIKHINAGGAIVTIQELLFDVFVPISTLGRPINSNHELLLLIRGELKGSRLSYKVGQSINVTILNADPIAERFHCEVALRS